MICQLSHMQTLARQGLYAIPHVLGGNLEMAYGAVCAAEELRSPLALGLAPEVFSRIPLEIAFPMLLNLAKRASVPVAVQLEHGKSYEQIAHAIRLGVNSVMFDGSSLPYEENIQRTAEIVKMAHALGACVEAELGCVGGSALRGQERTVASSSKTEPERVLDFVRRTGVDALAISFGNKHGKYDGAVEIDTELVRRISALTDTPLVMHGGSGLADAYYPEIVAAGISNIHFYSGVAGHAWSTLKAKIGEHDPFPPYHEVVAHSVEFFCQTTKHIIGLLGSIGRADNREET